MTNHTAPHSTTTDLTGSHVTVTDAGWADDVVGIVVAHDQDYRLALVYIGNSVVRYSTDRLVVVTHTRPTTSALGATRERSVGCLRCRTLTFNHQGECDACLIDGADR